MVGKKRMKNNSKNKEHENLLLLSLFLSLMLLDCHICLHSPLLAFCPPPHHPAGSSPVSVWSDRNFLHPAVGWTQVGTPPCIVSFLVFKSVASVSSFSQFIKAADYLLTARARLFIAWTLFFPFSTVTKIVLKGQFMTLKCMSHS